MQSSQERKCTFTNASQSYYAFAFHLLTVLALSLLSSGLVGHQVMARSGVTSSQPNDVSNELKYHQTDPQSTRVATDQIGSTSGARSAFPMTPFGDPFNLFNLFSRQPKDSDILAGQVGGPNSKQHSIDQDSLSSRGFYFEHFFGPSDESSEQTSDKLSSSQSKWPNFRDKQVGKEGDNSSLNRPSSPVMMVPGYGGSQLEARLDKPSVVRYFCDHKSDWSDVWINVKLLLPYMIDCLIDNLRLEFDHSTNTTRNTAGVEVRVKNGSSTSSVEYLNNLQISGFAYFAPIVNQLVEQLGYERESNVRGAPYDFRKAPNELGDYFAQLKTTSELSFEQNNRKPVSYICHSMGCNNMLYFLQRQSQRWKDKYVRRLISIAAPWGGSLSAMRAAALGDDLGMPYLFSESKLIRVQRSLPSTIFLFPHKKVFPDVPLIKTNVDPALSAPSQFPSQTNSSSSNGRLAKPIERYERFYQAQDYKSFFDDINHPDGYRMWLNTKDLLGSIEAPGVETWCLVGVGHKTLGRLEYLGEFPHSPSLELFDDGDGTVTKQSAEYCKKWSKQQELPVFYKEFQANHMEMLKDSGLLRYIGRILDDTSER